MKQRIKTSLLWLLLVLFCGGCFCIPSLDARRCDQQLIGPQQPRPVVAGVLDEQWAQDPLLYGLYKQRVLGPLNPAETWDAQDPRAGVYDLQEHFEGLQQAGVIPQQVTDWAWIALQRPVQWMIRSQDQQGFCAAEVGGMLPNGEQEDYFDLSIGWQEETGLVVKCALGRHVEAGDAEQVLRAYRSYLGLEALPDWKWVDTGSKHRAALWSETGQIYLYCSCGVFERFELQAQSVDPEHVRGSLTFREE